MNCDRSSSDGDSLTLNQGFDDGDLNVDNVHNGDHDDDHDAHYGDDLIPLKITSVPRDNETMMTSQLIP